MPVPLTRRGPRAPPSQPQDGLKGRGMTRLHRLLFHKNERLGYCYMRRLDYALVDWWVSEENGSRVRPRISTLDLDYGSSEAIYGKDQRETGLTDAPDVTNAGPELGAVKLHNNTIQRIQRIILSCRPREFLNASLTTSCT